MPVPERIASELLDSPAPAVPVADVSNQVWPELLLATGPAYDLSLIHISEPTRPY